MGAEVSHAALVERAGRWLTNTRGCVLVVTEPACWAIGEFPDAIGWEVGGGSVLVECKVSRRDFRRDGDKPSKRGSRETMGRERYYMTPTGMIDPADLPPGYGLLESDGHRVKVVVRACDTERPGRQDAELPLLVALSRRVAWSEGWKSRRVRLATEEVKQC